MTGLVWLVIGAGLLSLALTAYAAWRGAPWLPTPQRAVEAALDKVGVGPGDVVVDLGAGDGRVLRAAARRGVAAVGYELSPFLWALAWLRTRRQSVPVRVKFADAFGADVSTATVVFAFLRPATLPRLATSLTVKTTAENARLVSYAFPLHGISPRWTIRCPGCSPLYGYDLPLHLTGSSALRNT